MRNLPGYIPSSFEVLEDSLQTELNEGRMSELQAGEAKLNALGIQTPRTTDMRWTGWNCPTVGPTMPKDGV